MKKTISRSSKVERTPRVVQCEGIFDVAPTERSQETWDVDLPLEEKEWNIGLIVGPSGCGKSTIAREFFGDAVCKGFKWPKDKSLLDGFPKELGIKDVTELLSSVGFSSPPLWLRPFDVLSTGQQMRVTVARLLAENKDLAVMDEFTSVVDRTVAQIGSAAIAKTVRRRQQKFVAVTCHYDVQEWLQPDWVYQPHTREFLWRFPGKRPGIELEISRVHYSAWELFKPYHYLNSNMAKQARCFVAFIENQPVGLVGILPAMGIKNAYRISRLVVLPDFQGVGIGTALSNKVSDHYKALGKRMMITSSLPSLYHALIRNGWRLMRAPSFANSKGGDAAVSQRRQRTAAIARLTATLEYNRPEKVSSQAAEMLIWGELRGRPVGNPAHA